MSDLIDRQAAIEALNGIINTFEQILRDIRDSKVDDSVCGMCEYDGAYMGQSGDWCNECPGFDKDDCFKLSDECRKRWLKSVDLPSAQSDIVYCRECIHSAPNGEYGCRVYHYKLYEVHDMGANDFCSKGERRTDG